MEAKAKEHLMFALTQYRNNLGGVAEYVEKAETNLEQALSHKEETLTKIKELEDILGDDAIETPKDESVEEAEV